MKEGGLFWLQQPNTGMKLKKIIKEIENNDESTITVDKANLLKVAMRKTLILFLVVHIKKLLILMAVFLSKTQEVFKQVSLLK